MPADSNVKKLKRFNTLSFLHRQATTNTGIVQVSRLALREILDVFCCDCCAIILISGKDFMVLAEKDFSRKYCTKGSVQDIPDVDYTVKTGGALSVGITPAYLPSGHVIPSQHSNSILSVPIFVNNTVYGIIHISSHMENAFYQDDIDYAKSVAYELSKVFKNAIPLYYQDAGILFTQASKPLTQRKFDRDIIDQIASAEWERKPLSLLIVNISSVVGSVFKPLSPLLPNVENSIFMMLTTSLRPLDNIYYYGTRDLAILLPETSRTNALRIAQRLKDVLVMEPSHDKAGQTSANKVQIGVSNFPLDADYRDGLIRKACEGCYETAC